MSLYEASLISSLPLIVYGYRKLYVPPITMPLFGCRQRVLRLLRHDAHAAINFGRSRVEIDKSKINADERFNGGNRAIRHIGHPITSLLQHKQPTITDFLGKVKHERRYGTK